jgi:RNA polymerase sigma factor (sigma-70 family)
MKNISFKNDVLPLKNQLYRLALRITLNSAEAEDIVQETLIKIWNRHDSWNEIESMEAFSTTVCRNMALDSIKKHGNSNDSLDENSKDAPDNAYNPYEDIIHKDKVNVVRRIVNELPEKQRSCLQLRDFEGKSYKEIADILTITEEQVKVSIFRARQAVKLKFQEIDNYGL